MVVISLLVPTSFNYGQGVVINEFMASNGSTLADEDGDYEDYIELYNAGESKVDLKGFFLSDDYSNPYLWELPGVVLNPGDFLLVWASGKDRSHVDAPLHTNFRIDRDGEELILTDPDGRRLDEVAPTPLARDMSYGRYPDGSGSWLYLELPSPLQKNHPHVSETPMLHHYWQFDTDIPNNLPLLSVEPVYALSQGAGIEYISCLEGYPFDEESPFWRKASMERRNLPTPLNYRPEGNDGQSFADESVRGLQVKQPFARNGNENKIIFRLPTTGFENVVFRFAAKDEGAADFIRVEYSIDEPGEQWSSEGLADSLLPLSLSYQLYELDFSSIKEVDNNPHFSIRLRFEGDRLEEDDGNRVTFNNFTTDGIPLKAHYVVSSHGPSGMIFPFGFNRVFNGYDIGFNFYPTLNYLVESVWVNGEDVENDVVYDEEDVGFYKMKNVYKPQTIHTTFALDPNVLHQQNDNILVFPNPAQLQLQVKALEKIQKAMIFGLNGQFVSEYYVGDEKFNLDVSAFTAGVYIMKLQLQGKTVSRKVQIIN